MKYDKCNNRCEPDKGLHWLGDRYYEENSSTRICLGCGAIGIPHYGFSTPCPSSFSGGHYFDERTAQINAK